MKKEFKKIVKLFMKPYMRILPGNLAFSFMVALIPILSIIVFILNFLNIAFPAIPSLLSKIVPEAVLDIIMVFITQGNLYSSIFLIAGFWTASAGMNALIIASNVIYKCENTNYIQRRLKALGLTFLVIFMIIINLGVLVFGDSLVRFFVNLFSLSDVVLKLFSAIKWPFALVIIYYIVKMIYVVAPDKKIDNKVVKKGAIFTTLSWMIASFAFSRYVSVVNYSVKYGSLANIIILLIWLYIMSFVLVLGSAINVNEYEKLSH